MHKSLDCLIQRLNRLLESKEITKVELARRSGIDRSGLDKYLKGLSTPGIDVLDKIAGALGCDPRELIKPDDEPAIRAHSLRDCLQAVNEASRGKPVSVTLNIENAGTQVFSLGEPSLNETLADPILKEAISILSSFDQVQRAGALMSLRSIQRGTAIDEQEKKSK